VVEWWSEDGKSWLIAANRAMTRGRVLQSDPTCDRRIQPNPTKSNQIQVKKWVGEAEKGGGGTGRVGDRRSGDGPAERWWQVAGRAGNQSAIGALAIWRHLFGMVVEAEFRAPEGAGVFAVGLQQQVAFWIFVRFSSVA